MRSRQTIVQKAQKIFSLDHKVTERIKRQKQIEKEIARAKQTLRSIERKVTFYNDIFEKFQNIQKTKSSAKLMQEIQRLQEVALRYKEEAKEVSFQKPLGSVTVPILKKSLNPLRMGRNLQKYLHEKSQFEKVISNAQKKEVHMAIGKNNQSIQVTNNGTRGYGIESMKEHAKFLSLSEKLVCTYYLSDLPAYVSPHLLFSLLTSPIPCTISMFLEPTVNSSLIKQAKQRVSVLEMQQIERIRKGKMRDMELEKGIEETTQFISELVHEVEKGILFSCYVSITADTPSQMATLHKQFKNITDGMEFSFTRYTFGQKKAFETTLPFAQDTLLKNRIIQSTACSYLLPFVVKGSYDPNGVFFGMNAYFPSLVLLNPFTVRNSNINILGVSGAGKSVTAKLLATRLYMKGNQIIIIDPEGEYVPFAKKLGGEVVQFSRTNGINPFSLTNTSEDSMLDHITILKTFFKFFIPEGVYNGAELDHGLVAAYTISKGKPDLSLLLKMLKKSPMADCLRVLQKGSLQGIFNAERTLNLDADMLVFDISPLGDTEKKAPAMYLLTSLIWQVVNMKSQKKRMLFIDEAHKLLVDRDVAIFYREMVKQARKRDLGVVSITQDVEDFLYSEFGKAIITNSETKILLKQSYATLNLLHDIFPMTHEERQELGNLGVGEAILFRENEHMRVNVHVLPHEQTFL